MKVTIEMAHCTCTVDDKLAGDDKFSVLLDLFCQASLGVGYGQATINEHIGGSE